MRRVVSDQNQEIGNIMPGLPILITNHMRCSLKHCSETLKNRTSYSLSLYRLAVVLIAFRPGVASD